MTKSSQLLILHISDVHLKDGVDNPILGRAENIAAAVAGCQTNPSAILVVHSGDIAYSGKAEEYKIAVDFHWELLGRLKIRCPHADVAFTVVAGNHDCDFTADNNTRRLLLERATTDFTDQSPVETCLVVQSNFRRFIQDIAELDSSYAVVASESWFHSHSITLGGKSIRVNLLNTAWASQKNEQPGHLAIPVKLLQERIANDSSADLVVTVLHHPYTWLEAGNARSLRKLLDERSDLILTGHEHEASFYLKQVSTGENIEYIEGGVLQDSYDATQSSFNVILVDIDAESQRSMHFEWDSSSEFYTSRDHDVVRLFQRNKKARRVEFPFTEKHAVYLEEIGVSFSHPRSQSPQLSDLFVYPDLRQIATDRSAESGSLIRGKNVFSSLLSHERSLIIGAEGSGKTALAKSLARDLRRDGRIPLLINGSLLKSVSKLRATLDSAIDDQYGSSAIERFWQLEPASRAIIVDDYQRAPLTDLDRSHLLTYLSDGFGVLIVLASDQVRIEELAKDSGEGVVLLQLKHLEIMECGLLIRSQLVRKWHLLGVESSHAVGNVDEACERSEQEISAFLSEQYIPAYPLYVLIALQSLEMRQSASMGTQGSVGYLYETIVLQQLHKSEGGNSNIDTNKNYLSEMAYEFALRRITRISIEQLMIWHKRYCDEFQDFLDFTPHTSRLIDAKLIQNAGGQVSFRYPYLYYYFLAMYLANHITRESIREQIRVLATFLHQDDAANTILFLCHLSKDPFIIQSVMDTANSLFDEYPSATLTDESKFLGGVVIPDEDERRLLPGNAGDRRVGLYEEIDGFNEGVPEQDSRLVGDIIPIRSDTCCEIEQLSDQLKLNGALKTIQIIGQILRNHSGSMRGDLKKDLVRSCYDLGFRSMRCLFGVMEDNMPGMVAALVEAARKRSGGVSREKLIETVSSSLWGTIRLGTFALIKYMSDSVGMERLAATYDSVLRDNPTVAKKMVDVSIKLDYFRAFPEEETLQLLEELGRSRNYFTQSILKDLVFLRLYMYKSDYRVRQRICSKCGISDGGQRALKDQGAKSEVRAFRK